MDTDYPPKMQTDGGEPADGATVSPESSDSGHEVSDISIKGTAIFGVSLLIFLVGVLLAVALFFQGYAFLNGRLDGLRPKAEPAASSVVRAAPAYQGPLLQVKPEEDLRWMREHDASDLQSYGWVDRPRGIVRLPVSRAMDLLVERGLPPVSPGKTLVELQAQRAQPQVVGQTLRP